MLFKRKKNMITQTQVMKVCVVTITKKKCLLIDTQKIKYNTKYIFLFISKPIFGLLLLDTPHKFPNHFYKYLKTVKER